MYTYIVIFNNKIKFYIICKHCIFCPFRILISTNLDYFDGSFAIQNCLQNDNSLDGTKIQKETNNPITNTLNLTVFFLKLLSNHFFLLWYVAFSLNTCNTLLIIICNTLLIIIRKLDCFMSLTFSWQIVNPNRKFIYHGIKVHVKRYIVLNITQRRWNQQMFAEGWRILKILRGLTSARGVRVLTAAEVSIDYQSVHV